MLQDFSWGVSVWVCGLWCLVFVQAPVQSEAGRLGF